MPEQEKKVIPFKFSVGTKAIFTYSEKPFHLPSMKKLDGCIGTVRSRMVLGGIQHYSMNFGRTMPRIWCREDSLTILPKRDIKVTIQRRETK